MPLPQHLVGSVPLFAANRFTHTKSSWNSLVSATIDAGEGGDAEGRALLRSLIKEDFLFPGLVDGRTCRAFDDAAQALEAINVAERARKKRPLPPDARNRRARKLVKWEREVREAVEDFKLIDKVREQIRCPGSSAKMPMNFVSYFPASCGSIWEGGIEPHIDGPTTTPGGRERIREPENRVCVQAVGRGVLVLGLMVCSQSGHAISGPVLAYVTVELKAGDVYRLTEVLAGRVTVAARARGLNLDAVRVVHGVLGVSSRRLLVNISARV